MDKEQAFRYTYSAEQQQEIENIRKKYLPPEEDKMETLRALHNSASRKARSWAITLGVLGTLILGTGMSLCMTELAGANAMFLGIPVGLVGMVLVALAYPLYNHILKKERKRIAPEILRLTEELMQ